MRVPSYRRPPVPVRTGDDSMWVNCGYFIDSYSEILIAKQILQATDTHNALACH